MQKIGFVAAVVLLCSVTLVPAFSEDDDQESDHKFNFGGYSNKTASYDDYSNKTMFFDDSNKTGIGDEISDYVHKRNEIEKQQREKILDALKECRDQVKQSGNSTGMQQCIETLKSSLAQYKSFVSQQNMQFKQFRQGLLPLNHGILTPEQNKQNLNQFTSEVTHSHPNISAGMNKMHKNNRHH